MAKNKKIEEPVEETVQEISAEVPEEKIMSDEEIVAQDEFINEAPEELEVEVQKEHVDEFWNKVEEVLEEPVVKAEVEVGAPFDEPLPEVKINVQEEIVNDLDKNFGVEFHHEFQKDYFFGTPSESAEKETVIDVLPKPQRSLESLSRNEYREFQRTGKMPE